MYWCARISKPVGTPDIAHDQIRRCPCIGRTDISVNVFGNGVRVPAFTSRHVRTGFAASPQTACLRFFQTGLKSKSFYLSERAELSNKRLSFSATSVSFHSLPIRKRIVPRPCSSSDNDNFKKHATLHKRSDFFFLARDGSKG